MTLNGKKLSLPAPVALIELVSQNRLSPPQVVIEHNGAIVPRSAWQSTMVAANDRVEILQFVGGGN